MDLRLGEEKVGLGLNVRFATVTFGQTSLWNIFHLHLDVMN
jgi:hypothetical protein